MMCCYYIAVDGDDVGSYLEYLIVSNMTEELASFSSTYESAMSWLRSELVTTFEAKVIFCGGDNLLALISTPFTQEEIERIRTEFVRLTLRNLSIGLGESPRQALFALQYAKLSGKNCIRRFDELPNDQSDSNCCSKR